MRVYYNSKDSYILILTKSKHEKHIEVKTLVKILTIRTIVRRQSREEDLLWSTKKKMIQRLGVLIGNSS